MYALETLYTMHSTRAELTSRDAFIDGVGGHVAGGRIPVKEGERAVRRRPEESMR
jgi:hypothetical protein